jgi:hypothetical protein
MKCSCPECRLADLADRKLLRMVYINAFLFGALVAVVKWVW